MPDELKKLLFDSKLNLAIVVSIFFPVILGCQPEGGDLLPIGGEGVEITTSRFENDTVVINDNGLKIKFYGSWSGNSYVHLRIGFSNDLNQTVQIKFEQVVLKNGKNQNGKISTITEKPNFQPIYSNDKNLPVVNLKTGEKKSFNVEFIPIVNFSNADESDKTLYFSLPIEVGGKIKEYNVRFKAVDQKDNFGKSDPENW